MKTRAEVKEKIEHEGGLVAALEYGLVEDDMPEHDEALQALWKRLRLAWMVAELLAVDVTELLTQAYSK